MLLCIVESLCSLESNLLILCCCAQWRVYAPQRVTYFIVPISPLTIPHIVYEQSRSLPQMYSELLFSVLPVFLGSAKQTFLVPFMIGSHLLRTPRIIGYAVDDMGSLIFLVFAFEYLRKCIHTSINIKNSSDSPTVQRADSKIKTESVSLLRMSFYIFS